MIVRPAVIGDATALAAIAIGAINITAAAVYESEQIANWASSFSPEVLERVISTTAVFVVIESRTIAGFSNLLVVGEGRGEVDLLYVDPGCGGRGVAALAVEAVETEARARGITRLWADASLLAVPLFERLGYDIIERYVKHRGAVTFPNTWLAKDL